MGTESHPPQINQLKEKVMENNLVKVDPVVETEIVQDLEPRHVSASIQIIIPPDTKSIYKIHDSVILMNQKLDNQIRILDAIYSEESLDVLKNIQHKLDVHILSQTVEWTTLSILADKKGLTKDAIRKQLQSGDFEEGVDFKSDGNKIIVHQGAIGRIQRKRRSSNG